MDINGYETISSFYDDFTEAEQVGIPELIDMFDKIFDKYKDDCLYLTDLAMIVEHKMNEHKYRYNNSELSKAYAGMLLDVDCYACDNLKGTEAKYYMRTTDGDIKWSNYYRSLIV